MDRKKIKKENRLSILYTRIRRVSFRQNKDPKQTKSSADPEGADSVSTLSCDMRDL